MRAVLAIYLVIAGAIWVRALRSDFTLWRDQRHWRTQGRMHPRREFVIKAIPLDLRGALLWPLVALWLLWKALK